MSYMEKEPITLSQLLGGAIIEAVDHEIANALANIQDVNTNRTAKRKLDICIVFAPDGKGETVQLTYGTKSKLAPMLAGTTHATIAKTAGGDSLGLFEHEKHPQLPFGDEAAETPTPKPQATPLRRMAAAAQA